MHTFAVILTKELKATLKALRASVELKEHASVVLPLTNMPMFQEFVHEFQKGVFASGEARGLVYAEALKSVLKSQYEQCIYGEEGTPSALQGQYFGEQQNTILNFLHEATTPDLWTMPYVLLHLPYRPKYNDWMMNLLYRAVTDNTRSEQWLGVPQTSMVFWKQQQQFFIKYACLNILRTPIKQYLIDEVFNQYERAQTNVRIQALSHLLDFGWTPEQRVIEAIVTWKLRTASL